MSKIQVFLLSLVGAVPAGFLSYLIGMYLINQPSGASTMVMVLSIITLICSATLTVIPFLVLSMYFSNYDPPKISKFRGKEKDVETVDEFEDEEEAPSSKKSKSKKSEVVSDDEIEEFEDAGVSDELAIADDDEDFAALDEEEEDK